MVANDGIYNICPHCEKYSKCYVEEGAHADFLYCMRCHRLVGKLDHRSKKLYYWHKYNKGCVLPEEEAPYP